MKQGVRSARLEGRNRSSEPSRTKHLSGTQRKLRLPMLRPVVVWSGATVDRLIRLAYLARVQAQGLNACGAESSRHAKKSEVSRSKLRERKRRIERPLETRR